MSRERGKREKERIYREKRKKEIEKEEGGRGKE